YLRELITHKGMEMKLTLLISLLLLILLIDQFHQCKHLFFSVHPLEILLSHLPLSQNPFLISSIYHLLLYVHYELVCVILPHIFCLFFTILFFSVHPLDILLIHLPLSQNPFLISSIDHLLLYVHYELVRVILPHIFRLLLTSLFFALLLK